MRGRRDLPRERIGEQEERAARQCRSWEQHALIVADYEPHGMRDDEPHEADRTGGRHRGGGEERGEGEQEPWQARHVHAQRGGGGLAPRKRVEIACERQRRGQRQRQRAERRPRDRRRREIADQPEQHAAQLRFGCDRQDERDEGAPSGGDHHTGEQESRRRPRAYAAREAEHQ